MRYLQAVNMVLTSDDDLDNYRIRLAAKALDVAQDTDEQTGDAALDNGARLVASTLKTVLGDPRVYMLTPREQWALQVQSQVDRGVHTRNSLLAIVNPV